MKSIISQDFNLKLKLKLSTSLAVSCERLEEFAILISRLLLHMPGTYLANIRLDFQKERIECVERSLIITSVLTFYHLKRTQRTTLDLAK